MLSQPVVRKPPVCYYIRSKTSELVLEVKKGGHQPGTDVIVAKKRTERQDSEWQHWYFEEANQGFVYIASKLNGLVLDIKEGNTCLILNYRIPPPQVVASQKWNLNGGVIESQLNSMVIHTKEGGRLASGSKAVICPRTGEDHQQWVFEAVSTVYDDSDQPAGQSIRCQRQTECTNAVGQVMSQV